MTDRKLILPTELKVCATCTYWDGERTVDEEMRVVVVCESCHGECLVSESQLSALSTRNPHCECMWEDVGEDDPAVPDDTPHALPAAK